MEEDMPFLWLLILLATYIMHLCPLDIDECAEANTGLNNCEQNCNNTVGSFECSCRQGYQPVGGAPNRCEGTETEHCCLMVVHTWVHRNCHNTSGYRVGEEACKGATPPNPHHTFHHLYECFGLSLLWHCWLKVTVANQKLVTAYTLPPGRSITLSVT